MPGGKLQGIVKLLTLSYSMHTPTHSLTLIHTHSRTPMKRPSLVQECYKTVSTNPTHPPTYIRTPAQLNSTARRKTLSTHSTKKIAQKVSSENSKTVGQTSEQKMTETSSRKLTRRYKNT